jgi:hypothetical protein
MLVSSDGNTAEFMHEATVMSAVLSIQHMVEHDCVDNCFVLTNGMSTSSLRSSRASFEFTHEASVCRLSHPPHMMEHVCIDKGFLLSDDNPSSTCTPIHCRRFPAPLRAAVK